jgi:hypothetical protein
VELPDDSVDAGVEDDDVGVSAVNASAAPPLNSPASTTAKTARCFFTTARILPDSTACRFHHRHTRSSA